MQYDVIVIGAGISGLTAGSLLAKRGLKVAVIDKSYNPGGSCGIFKRNGIIFDQGAAMLFGFGEKGFNPHRFVFNCLEEPINVIKHDFLYCVNYKGKRIKFWPDVNKFSEELGEAFPSEKENIKRFYEELSRIYQYVAAGSPVQSTLDEALRKNSLKTFLRHPMSTNKFLSCMNKNAESLLNQFFHDPEILKFFDKLTSTYCYTTIKETPAILAAIMFIENHAGGIYYPAGSTLFLPGKLEKAIEENDGEMIYQKEVVEIIFKDRKPVGVILNSGERLTAKDIVYSGTVWNLYGKLIKERYLSAEQVKWAKNLVPTYPSVVLYTYVDSKVIPEDTLPIEMLVGNTDKIGESEITAYILSIDDRTLCEEDGHVIEVIVPTLKNWNIKNKGKYLQLKEKEKDRLLNVLEKRFPGLKKAVRYSEVATPRTIERYTNKNGGAAAGPKQMMGQHMLNRLHTRSQWDTLYCCGESTVMGTGTPAVTISGLSAANAILRKSRLKEYTYNEGMKNYVNIVQKPFTRDNLYSDYPEEERSIMLKAHECQYCEHPECTKGKTIAIDVRGVMRRVAAGNFKGARKLAEGAESDILSDCQERCIQNVRIGKPVEIKTVFEYLMRR